jgi:uncharacterized membrane protein YccC
MSSPTSRLSAAVDALARPIRSLSEPATQTDLLQILKSTAAAVTAWWIADGLLGLEQSFLAAWTALLTVHATVYRTFVRGAQSVLATVLGVLISVLIAEVVGVSVVSLAVALVVGLLLASVGVLRDERITTATTALFVLTSGYEQQESMLGDRFADTAIGVGVGLLINLVVLPPLTHRSAAQQIERVDRALGELLSDMAAQMAETPSVDQTAEWIEASRRIDGDLERGWQLARDATESQWWNPRARLARTRLARRRGRRQPLEGLDDVLVRLEDGVAQVRTISRVVHESTRAAAEWAPMFREPWLRLLAELGERVADPHADVAPLRDEIDQLVSDLSDVDLPESWWPTYGALITATSAVIDIVDDVASSPVVAD